MKIELMKNDVRPSLPALPMKMKLMKNKVLPSCFTNEDEADEGSSLTSCFTNNEDEADEADL